MPSSQKKTCGRGLRKRNDSKKSRSDFFQYKFPEVRSSRDFLNQRSLVASLPVNVACTTSPCCPFSSFKCLSTKGFWDSRLHDLMTHLITFKRLYFSHLFVVLFILLYVLYSMYNKTGNDHLSFTFYTIHTCMIPHLSHLFGRRRTFVLCPTLYKAILYS